MGAFDRQLRIQNWDQGKIENSVCLILGVGGIGTGVAMGLARLGVKKLILVDKDVVDISNLNRQILFSPQHVGKPKVDVAAEMLKTYHLINPATEIETYHFDVLPNWPTIVKLVVKEATVVFNNIDVGEYYDAAVMSLCIHAKKLLICGGNFAQQFCVDSVKPG